MDERLKYVVVEPFCFGTPHGDVGRGRVLELTAQEARPYTATGRLRPATEADVDTHPVPDVQAAPEPAADADEDVEAGDEGFPEGEPAEPTNQDPKPTKRKR
jgi:hypothetical protein